MPDGPRPSDPIERGGTRAPRPEELQSPMLQLIGGGIVQTVVERTYFLWPLFDERYGALGRHHAVEHARWNLAKLDVALAFPTKPFADHVAWVRPYLKARGVGDAFAAFVVVALRDALVAASLPPEFEADRAHSLSEVSAALELFPPELHAPPTEPQADLPT